MKTKSIKLCDYVVVTIDGQDNRLSNRPRDLWDFLGWDIDNDKEASECASIVTQNLFCYGFCDISALTRGKHTVVIKFKFEE